MTVKPMEPAKIKLEGIVVAPPPRLSIATASSRSSSRSFTSLRPAPLPMALARDEFVS